MLLLLDPIVSLIAAFLSGGIEGGIYLFFRNHLKKIWKERLRANKERFQIAQDALGGIKELSVDGLEMGYMRSFSKLAQRFSKNQAANAIVNQLPRFALEGLAIGGMPLLIFVFLAYCGESLDSILPTLGVFTFAGMRFYLPCNMFMQVPQSYGLASSHWMHFTKIS